MSPSAVPVRDEGADSKADLKGAYEQLCKTNETIDGFRTTLLHLLPVASAGGIFLILNKDAVSQVSIQPDLIGAVGVFGFLITLGFFVFEIYGIRKCHAIILAGKEVERQLGMPGPFTNRPRAVLGHINEPFAAGIIYPAVMAGWIFLGLHFAAQAIALWAAVLVFCGGLAATFVYNSYLKYDSEVSLPLRSLGKRMVHAEEAGDLEALRKLLAPEFQILRSDGKTYSREEYLRNVPAARDRGRSASQVVVSLAGWRKAVLTCQVSTTRDAAGKAVAGHFWNTQRFSRRGDEWLCVDWRVENMYDQ